MFNLSCPQAIGSLADYALGNTISTYVHEEFATAEREEASFRTLILSMVLSDSPVAGA